MLLGNVRGPLPLLREGEGGAKATGGREKRVLCVVARSRRVINLAGLDFEAGQFSGAEEDSGEHGAVEAAGVGVSERGVVGGQQMEAVWQQVGCAVRETVGRFAGDDAGMEQVGEVAVEGDLSQADDDANPGKRVDFACEMAGAVAEFLWQRFISRWGAAEDGGDPGMAQLEAVVAGDGSGFAGEAELVEDRVHEVAGAVSGEGTAGAVGSVSSGRKAKDEDAGARVAEAGYGFCPVGLIEVGAPLGLADGAAVDAETGTALAGDDGVANLLEDGRRYLYVRRGHCIQS